MYELLWLLLPVAAASGWWIGRRNAAPDSRPIRRALGADYFKGLNHLLNEQPDKAIEVFIRMLEAEGETAEIHLALGSLFRRRGEVDRAIRVHQNLIARPTLTTALRGEALLELGLDYSRAGLYDRAEAIFLDLVEMRAHGERALVELLAIFTQEKEWSKAIDAARRLAALSGQAKSQEIAHFHCELAEESAATGDLDGALQQAAKALSVDPRSVRASLLLGDLETRRGQPKAAIRAYRRVPEQEPDFLPEVIGRLRSCYEATGRIGDLRQFLQQQVAVDPGICAVLAMAELIRAEEGSLAAGEYIIGHLDERPSLRGLHQVIELSMEIADGRTREILQVLGRVVSGLLGSKPGYRCTHCGFEGRSLHWQCPSCRTWASVRPVRGIEGS